MRDTRPTGSGIAIMAIVGLSFWLSVAFFAWLVL